MSKRFNRLADADIVRDEQPHGVLAERHDQRNDLVGARPKRELRKGTERAGAVAEAPAARVVEKPGRADVAKVSGRGRLETSVDGTVGLDLERKVDSGDLVVRAAERLDDEQIGVIRRQHYPFAAAQRDELSGLRSAVIAPSGRCRGAERSCGKVFAIVPGPDLVASGDD